MNLAVINNMITELEKNDDTSLSNIRNLSALYTVKDHLSISNESTDKTVLELNDILPSYIQYKAIKRKYQLGETSKERVTSYLYSVCKEIKEFMQTLYSGTDMQEERDILKQLIKDMQ